MQICVYLMECGEIPTTNGFELPKAAILNDKLEVEEVKEGRRLFCLDEHEKGRLQVTTCIHDLTAEVALKMLLAITGLGREYRCALIFLRGWDTPYPQVGFIAGVNELPVVGEGVRCTEDFLRSRVTFTDGLLYGGRNPTDRELVNCLLNNQVIIMKHLVGMRESKRVPTSE